VAESAVESHHLVRLAAKLLVVLAGRHRVHPVGKTAELLAALRAEILHLAERLLVAHRAEILHLGERLLVAHRAEMSAEHYQGEISVGEKTEVGRL
jgi:hypothetical protein